MKAKAIALTIFLVFVSVAMGFQNNPQLGTWKLNEAKSKFAGKREITPLFTKPLVIKLRSQSMGLMKTAVPFTTNGPESSMGKIIR